MVLTNQPSPDKPKSLQELEDAVNRIKDESLKESKSNDKKDLISSKGSPNTARKFKKIIGDSKDGGINKVNEDAGELIDTLQKEATPKEEEVPAESGDIKESEENPQIFKKNLSEGPVEVTKLSTFLLNVPEEQLSDKEAVYLFMKNMIKNEMDFISEKIESVINEADYDLLEAIINKEYFLRSVQESLENRSYVNTRNSPVVDWINAKRKFYAKMGASGPEELRPAHKETIKRLETIGKTLIIQK